MRNDDTAPEYLAEQVRQAIATDPRTAEQGMGVRVLGSEVLVTGSVSSEERRAAIGQVAAEVAAGLVVRNDVAVVPPADHHHTERVT